MHGLIAVATVAALIFLGGCGIGGGGAGQPGGDGNGGMSVETSPKTTDNGTGLADRPPESTLSFGGRTVTGALGSYCWGSVCVEAAGIPVPPQKDTLTIPAGSTLTFEFGGEGPYEADSGTYPLDPEARTLPGPGGLRFLAPGEEKPIPEPMDLKTARADGRTRITADLPTGKYILAVFVDPGNGDASYYYRLRVEPNTGEDAAQGILFARQPSEGNSFTIDAAEG